jgi:hypothetical protein
LILSEILYESLDAESFRAVLALKVAVANWERSSGKSTATH